MLVLEDHVHLNSVASSVLVGSMWLYATNILYPAQILKRIGISISNQELGEVPKIINKRGLGPCFSVKYHSPVMMNHKTANARLVDEFDRMSAIYQRFVEPFSQPIFEEATKFMLPFLSSDSRVLDVGCGPGKELQRIATLVPDGEVVGIDLAAGMVKTAYKHTRTRGVDNCAFFQADVENLPRIFNNNFDLVYSCLAHHHYPKPALATSSILRTVRPGGIYCVIDPGPPWYNVISSPIAKWGDPGWIGFHTPEEFMSLFKRAGFTRSGWRELLPGFGVAIGQKDVTDHGANKKKNKARE